MSDGPGGKEAQLGGYGLIRVVEGEHSDAWKAFWGVDIQLQEEAMWKQWSDALRPLKRNAPLVDLAKATPWKVSLARTDGRIMVSDEYERLEARTADYTRGSGCDDSVIAGQSGSGRSYLSHFILAHALSRRQNIIFFTGKHVVLFCPLGAYSGEALNVDLSSCSDFCGIIEGRPVVLVDVDKERDTFGPPEMMFSSIRVYPPNSHHYERWIGSNGSNRLVLDPLPARSVVSAATLQCHIKATTQCLQQLMTCLRVAGINLRSSLSLDSSTLRSELREYISGLTTKSLAEFANRARLSRSQVKVARPGEGPDIVLLRREMTPAEACLPVIASRHILGEISTSHGFAGLSILKNMEAVRRTLDGFLDTRTWLFEHLCHALLSSESPEPLPGTTLSQCFPDGASKRKGALKMAHLCVSRTLETFDVRAMCPFDPEIYHIVETLADGTLHALLHARPHQASRKPGDRVAPAVAADQTRKLRPRVRTAEVVDDRLTKRRKLPADRRFIIFMQIICGTSPELTNDGLRQLEDIMLRDADAEYYYVFVTAKEAVLDLSIIPPHWINRLKWYHLSMDVTVDGGHFIHVSDDSSDEDA
ncbi:unnamed protein product [Peniophora sp. CBMAI 1063]|nr:unnamed protein product [Peniophora sp. CBMAI 1063]